MNKHALAALLAAASLTVLPSIQAATIYGVTTSNVLVRFDSASPGTVTTIGTISAAAGTIADLDFYPVNSLLYAFNTSGTGFRINLTDASATLAITPAAGITGTVTDADFNPSADRVRIFASGGTNQNYRLVPDVETNGTGATPGTVIVDGTFTDATVNLVGSAYTNNFDGAGSTALYSIDTTNDRLIVHSVSPQFNTVAAVGTNLGVTVGSNVGFDIAPDGTAYLTNDNTLYTVDLATGVATLAGTVSGSGLKTIAAQVPEPATGALLAVSLLAAAGLRRRRVA
jgi:hypothetical protein